MTASLLSMMFYRFYGFCRCFLDFGFGFGRFVDGIFEFTQALAQGFADARKFAWAKDDQTDD